MVLQIIEVPIKEPKNAGSHSLRKLEAGEKKYHYRKDLSQQSFWSTEPRKHIKSIIYGGMDGIITIFAMVCSSSGVASIYFSMI